MPLWRRPRIVREGGGEVKSRQRLSSAVGRRLFSSSISWYCPSTTTHWPWLACWFTCGHLRNRRCPHTVSALPRITVLGRLVSSCASRCNQPSSTQDTHQSYSCSVPIPTTFCPASAVLAKPYPHSLFHPSLSRLTFSSSRLALQVVSYSTLSCTYHYFTLTFYSSPERRITALPTLKTYLQLSGCPHSCASATRFQAMSDVH